ncbi:four-carbon acid sugar kinase family protein [Sedimentitalea sp. XS_ASV28]|uniref:four-carbon acid sugar kinase family protein n=1 Tax=Sedimentitalea sp. XS_ASV28 TaxID=3241296 RepID=UPI0035119ED0
MVRAVFIGDDFTGASDTLATFASAGWRTRLFLKPPRPEDCAGLDTIGFATSLRAQAPDAALDVIADLWPAIEALAPQTIHLKVCSTFDSSPMIGSIGAIANDLARRFSPKHLAVIGGQPNLGRYCVFGTLFAWAADGVVHRIDRHPVMAHHPVTPMTEADLRRLLAAQGLEGLDLCLSQEAVALPLRTLFDVRDASDIRSIANTLAPLAGRRLLIGASSVAQVLTKGTPGTGYTEPPRPPAHKGVLVFAGSRSPVTKAQVASATEFRCIPVLPVDFVSPTDLSNTACSALDEGIPVLLHTDPDLDYGMTPDELANASAGLLGEVLAYARIGWLGIAGGDTSSRICELMEFSAIDFLEEISPGVALCRVLHPANQLDGLRLMLKGGQMGDETLFNRFLGLARS